MVTGGRIWKLSAFEVPPPGAGVVTATETLEAVVRLLVGIVAVKVEAFVTVVGSADPAQRICEPETNPVPETVSERAWLPASAEAGERLVRVGTAFVIENVVGGEVPPPGDGFVTETATVPAAARSCAVRETESAVGLTTLTVDPDLVTAPQSTLAPFTKFVPVMVTHWALLPAPSEEGVRLVMVGAGFWTLKDTVFDL
jgi:hypothetical protein